jgi:AcrR family transcriptional regulator
MSRPQHSRQARPVRRRDAESTRAALLSAASELFAARGFEGTTTRDVGARAGVDPALIARYFGGKTQLYVATLHAEGGDQTPADLLHPERVRELLERTDRPGGPGPVLAAAVRPHDDEATQAVTRAALQARLVVPLRERLERAGSADPGLRAEVAAAAVVGVLLARRAGALGRLASADRDDVAGVLGDLLAALAPVPEAHQTGAAPRSRGERTHEPEVLR